LELIVSSHIIMASIDIDFSKVVGSSNRFSSFVASITIIEMMSLSRSFFSFCDLHSYMEIGSLQLSTPCSTSLTMLSSIFNSKIFSLFLKLHCELIIFHFIYITRLITSFLVVYFSQFSKTCKCLIKNYILVMEYNFFFSLNNYILSLQYIL